MKKILVAALLVAILASSFVFAGFKGSAEAQFGWDIDNKTFGFENLRAPKFEFKLDSVTGNKAGEGEVYAEIKATLKASLDTIKSLDDNKERTLKFYIDDLEANVIGEGWKVGLTGVKYLDSFATSYTKNSNGKAKYDYKLWLDGVAGLNAEVAEYKFSLGFNKGFAKESYDARNGAFFSFATPKYAFLDDALTVKAGAAAVAYSFDMKDTRFGAGFAANYKNDAFSAKLASDFGYKAKPGEETRVNADVEAQFAYSPVTLDVYYATYVSKIKNLLNAKVSAKLDEFVGMPLSFSADFQDLVNDARNVTVAANTTVEGVELGLSYQTNMKKPLEWNVKAEAAYDFDVAKVDGSVQYVAKDNTLAIEAGVSSTTLVDNATLALTYKGLVFDFDKDQNNKYGAIVASCKVSF